MQIQSTPTQTTRMRVRKRDGSSENVDVTAIVAVVRKCAHGLNRVDADRVAIQTIGGLYDGATTKELDELAIQTAASMIGEEPEYSKLAARLLNRFIIEELLVTGITSFSESVVQGYNLGLIGERLYQFVTENADALNAIADEAQTDRFDYFALRTVYDRYLLRHPHERTALEGPQSFFLRVASSLSTSIEEVKEFYGLLSTLSYLPSSPTLFNSGTKHEQLSSCFLLDSPQDSLTDIYKRYADIAQLSKFSGGIGLAYHRIRSRGSLIKSTNGHSNGIVPWLKTLDSSVAAVNQGGKRKGACCVYLESWHADIEDFLELRDNTGDEARRTHNLNLANWISDLFMKRVASGEKWSLFDPKTVPHLCDTFGADFEKAYEKAERDGLAVRVVEARDLYRRMMRTLAQTGNGWMTFKDASNLKSNQTGKTGRAIHLSNLCTEILEVTDSSETAVCNLGSVNLSEHVTANGFDFEKLRKTVQIAVRHLDRVIDLNFYPIKETGNSNSKWRPVGLGVMGLQDVFFKLRLPFDSPHALELSTRIQEEVYFGALNASCDLAANYGAHPNFAETRAANGELQFDSWNVVPPNSTRWEALKARINTHGLRNSLLIAIAPTATIATIAGCQSCIEPQISNLFKRETLSGEFLQINQYLVDDLRKLGLWTAEIRDAIKAGEGSIQDIEEIPEEMRHLYRTSWELSMKSLIDLAAARGPYIDQSQSLNLFIESPNLSALSSMYMYAWQSGLKTTYYLRSRPATRIAKTTISEAETARLCSLENPESCEACQ